MYFFLVLKFYHVAIRIHILEYTKTYLEYTLYFRIMALPTVCNSLRRSKRLLQRDKSVGSPSASCDVSSYINDIVGDYGLIAAGSVIGDEIMMMI